MVFGDHFDRTVLLDLKRASFAQEPIGCTINDIWNFLTWARCADQTNTWSAWYSIFVG